MRSRARPAGRSGTADWLRALHRTAPVTSASARTLAVVVDEMALRYPDRPALVDDNTSLDYATLSERIDLYAQWARARLAKGDAVALMMGNAPEYVAIWLGLSRAGIVTALINTQLVGDSLAHCVVLAAPRIVIVDAARLGAIEDIAQAGGTPVFVHGGDAADPRSLAASLAATARLDREAMPVVTLADPALLIYTSGTTGLPKAAHVSHYRIVMWSEWFAGLMDATPEDRLYDCLPMYHSVGGVVAVGAMLASGGAIIVRDGFSASRFWRDVVASGATIFQYIGDLCRYLVTATDAEASRGHRLRLACGNGLRADVWEAFEHHFAIPRILEFYAATEGSFSLFNVEGRRGAIGRIPSFMAHRSPVAIVRFDVEREQPMRGEDGFCVRCGPDDVGEAIGRVVHAEGLATRFEGYTDAAESERKILRDVFAAGDMWFRTGDLMRRDTEGFFYFVDRIGDTFRWKGENVATAEVADVLCGCPGVLDATVYGVAMPSADGRAGMVALAVAPEFEIDALQHHVETRLPRYARPVFVRLCASLDATATFKTRKGDLKAEGFDPDVIGDPLYLFVGDRFVRLDAALYARVVAGELLGAPADRISASASTGSSRPS